MTNEPIRKTVWDLSVIVYETHRASFEEALTREEAMEAYGQGEEMDLIDVRDTTVHEIYDGK